MPVFRKQKRPTLLAQTLLQIREAIKSGKIKSGERLIEADLASQMHVSRYPVREAVRYLEKEGLVVTIPFKGTYVATFSERDLEELYSLRSALEELALRILISNLDADKIQKLDSILLAMEQAGRAKRVDKAVSEDMRFHRTICELSNHRKLLEMWLSLERQLRTFIELEYCFKEPKQLVETHYPVIEAIKSSDYRRAERCIREHLASALEVIKRYHSNKPRR